MLLCSLSSPIPFPSLNPPSQRCRLSFLPLSPRYSTTSATATATPIPQSKDFMVDYFVNSLGFSTDEARSASLKVNHLKSSINPRLVLNLFLKYGLTEPQIKAIVSSAPKILLHKVDRTLEPKIKFFLQDMNFSVSDLVKLIKKNPGLLSRGLDTCIIPTINYLKERLGGDENVVQIVMDSPWLLSSPSSIKRMQLNVMMLQDYGLTEETIRKFIIRNPRYLLYKPERFKDALSRVDKELGIPLDSPMLIRGICSLASVSNSEASLQMRLKIFRSFGWTDSDIRQMSKSQPACLTMSEGKIRIALNFLMGELGYTPEYLASHACLLMYSMENRVKPRYEVLKILKEKKLVGDKPGLFSLVIASESKFLERYVLRYEDELPNLYEIYRKSRKQSSLRPSLVFPFGPSQPSVNY